MHAVPYEPPPNEADRPKSNNDDAAGSAADKMSVLVRRWGDEHEKKTEMAKQALAKLAPEAAEDEQLLLGLAASGGVIAQVLEQAQYALAIRLQGATYDPRLALTIAKTLREVAAVSGAVSKRVRGCLETTSSLRGQRRFLQHHGVRRDGV